MSAPRVSRRASVDPRGEFPFAASDYVLHLLAAIAMFRDAALDNALRPMDLNVGRFRTLSVLARCGACTMSELSSFSAIDRTTLTRIADQLVAAELVVRQAARDRRQVVLDLTDAGRAAHIKGLLAVGEHNRIVLRDIDEADLRSAARLVASVIENQTDNEATRASIIRHRRDPA